MLGTTLHKIEEALGEIAEAVSKHSTLLLLTKMKTFPKITLNPDANESIHYATDELIRCQRALNNARRHLTNLGITPDTPIDPAPPLGKLGQYAQHPNKIPLDQPASVVGKPIPPIGQKYTQHPPSVSSIKHNPDGTTDYIAGKPLTPGNTSETKTQSTQTNESSVRQPVRTDIPRVLGKPIGLPDNLSPRSES